MSYKVSLKCENCDHVLNGVIPKGKLVKDFIDTAKCSKCGCVGTLSKTDPVTLEFHSQK